MRRPASVVVAALLLLVSTTGCRLGVVAEVAVQPDGTGTVGVSFHLDDELLDELDALGVDPTAELSAAVLDADAWELERAAVGDGLVVRIHRPVDSPAGFGDALRELSAGLGADDPALLVDVEVAVDDEGASRVDGVAAFRPPATAGLDVDGEPVGPSGPELADLVARSVAPALVVTLPGEPVRSDADGADGRTLRWQVPVAAERVIGAQAEPAPWWEVGATWLLLAAGVAVLLLLAALLWRTRRRRRRADAAASWV